MRWASASAIVKTKSSDVCIRSADCPISSVMFQGGREVSDFISYLKREATNPLVVQEESKKKKKKKKDDDKSEL